MVLKFHENYLGGVLKDSWSGGGEKSRLRNTDLPIVKVIILWVHACEHVLKGFIFPSDLKNFLETGNTACMECMCWEGLQSDLSKEQNDCRKIYLFAQPLLSSFKSSVRVS